MSQTFIDNQTFDKIDVKTSPLQKGEYDNCTFSNCDLSNADLSGIKFIDCIFNSCNLSLAKLAKTALQNIRFRDSKMLGLRFDTCNEFGISFTFDNCTLDHSSFYRLKIRKTVFKNSHLHEVDLTECDLSGAVFDNCDLARVVFDNTIIEKADLRTSYNYSLDPEKNRIKNAKFSLTGAVGLLDKYEIDIDDAH